MGFGLMYNAAPMAPVKNRRHPSGGLLPAGVSLDGGASALRRLNFFDGKFLRAQDLELEQNYHRRSLAFANRAGGWGVVDGLCVTVAADGRDIVVDSGLAIDPAGWVLHLPRQSRVPLVDVLADPAAELATTPTFSRGTAIGFETCEQKTAPSGPRAAPGTAGYWVLRVTQDEALCGTEEVFGGLCGDACVTDLERSHRDEGVRIFAELVTLTLPSSKAVQLDESHRRSRAASAYFNRETPDPAHLVHKPGILSDVWCCGAEVRGGPGVPLGLLYWDGTKALFLDCWAARRERMEAPPKRYWSLQLRMRSWDVFLAQVLQFQCQLTRILEDRGRDGVGDRSRDPCRDPKAALAEAERWIASVQESYRNFLRGLGADAFRGFELPGGLAGLEALIELVKKSGAGTFVPKANDRILVDGGIVELPPAGYLPIELEGASVNAQVRALLGPGVDLRFAVVTTDYVAHALEEAQHMDRISLLRGLDDPSDKPKVDILVPDGELRASEAVVRGKAFETQVAIDTGARLRSEGVGRFERQTSGGGTFYYAGALVSRAARGGAAGRDDAELPELSDAVREALRRYAFVASSNLADRRTELLASEDAAAPERGLERLTTNLRSYRGSIERTSRVGAAWLQADLANDALALAVGQSTHARAKLYAFAEGDKLQELTASGELEVTQVGGALGVVDRFVVGQIPSLTVQPVNDGKVEASSTLRNVTVLLAWSAASKTLRIIAHLSKPALLVSIEAHVGSDAPLRLTINLSAAPAKPMHVEALKKLIAEGKLPLPTGDGPAVARATAGLQESEAVLAAGSGLRAGAESAIDLLAGALLEVSPELSFAESARARLFGDDPTVKRASIVMPRRDWVLFHKRRERTEAEWVAPKPPVRPVRYAVYHLRVNDDRTLELDATLSRLRANASVGGRLPFDPRRTLTGAKLVGVAEYESGGDQLLNPAIALDVLAHGPGNGLATALIATNGAADPELRERRRVERLVGALPDTIDATSAKTWVLGDVPAPFVVPGTDGFVLLVTRTVEVRDLVHIAVLPKAGGGNRAAVMALVRAVTQGDVAVFKEAAERIATARFDRATGALRDFTEDAWRPFPRARWRTYFEKLEGQAREAPASVEARELEANLPPPSPNGIEFEATGVDLAALKADAELVRIFGDFDTLSVVELQG